MARRTRPRRRTVRLRRGGVRRSAVPVQHRYACTSRTSGRGRGDLSERLGVKEHAELGHKCVLPCLLPTTGTAERPVPRVRNLARVRPQVRRARRIPQCRSGDRLRPQALAGSAPSSVGIADVEIIAPGARRELVPGMYLCRWRP